MMKHRAMRYACLAVALIALPVFSAGAGLTSSPSAPPPGDYVNDYAGVMDPGTVVKLNSVLAELDAKAHAQVAVLTVKSLGSSDIDTYAVDTFQKWGVGNKKTDRGVLLLVATRDHKSRIEVGYGLEPVLTDGLTGEIQDKYMLPYFKKGDYSDGVYYGALAVASVIAEDSKVQLTGGLTGDEGQTDGGPPLTTGQKVLGIIFLILAIYFILRHPFLAYMLFSSMMSGGGGGGFGGGGSFGGFGGGLSGGGGSSRSW